MLTGIQSYYLLIDYFCRKLLQFIILFAFTFYPFLFADKLLQAKRICRTQSTAKEELFRFGVKVRNSPSIFTVGVLGVLFQCLKRYDFLMTMMMTMVILVVTVIYIARIVVSLVRSDKKDVGHAICKLRSLLFFLLFHFHFLLFLLPYHSYLLQILMHIRSHTRILFFQICHNIHHLYYQDLFHDRVHTMKSQVYRTDNR